MKASGWKHTDLSMVKYEVAIVYSVVAELGSNVPYRNAWQGQMGGEVTNLHDKRMETVVLHGRPHA